MGLGCVCAGPTTHRNKVSFHLQGALQCHKESGSLPWALPRTGPPSGDGHWESCKEKILCAPRSQECEPGASTIERAVPASHVAPRMSTGFRKNIENSPRRTHSMQMEPPLLKNRNAMNWVPKVPGEGRQGPGQRLRIALGGAWQSRGSGLFWHGQASSLCPGFEGRGPRRRKQHCPGDQGLLR